MLRKPSVMLPVGLITLIFCILDYSFPVMKLFFSLGMSDVQSVFSSVIYTLKLLLKLLITARGLAAATGAVVFVSMILALIFSGYFNKIGLCLDGKKNLHGQYLNGIRRHFPRILLITLVLIIASVLLFILMAVALVPGLIVTNTALGGKTGYIGVAVIVDIITVFVFFFVAEFYRIYTSFCYPSAIMFGKNAFRTAKRVADTNFWGLVGKFFLLDGVLIFLLISFAYMGPSLLLLPIKWLLLTLFLTFMIIYVFALFRDSLKRASK